MSRVTGWQILGVIVVLGACSSSNSSDSSPAKGLAGGGGIGPRAGAASTLVAGGGAAPAVVDASGGTDPGTEPVGELGGADPIGEVAGAAGIGGEDGTGLAGAAGRAAASKTIFCPGASNIALTKAVARMSGRRGDQLIVTADGSSALGLFASVQVTLLDAANNEMPFFDSNWDGNVDTATVPLVPTKLPTTTSFSVEGVLARANTIQGLSALQVALVDRCGVRTKSLNVPVTQLPMIELGGSCDPKFQLNRCREGLACTGNPTVCASGTAPTISHAAYHRNPEGPYFRVDGIDPDEDVVMVRLEFFDNTDKPVLVDLDSDEVPDSDHFEVEAGLSNQNGGYTFVVQAGLSFDQLVPRVKVTAIDSKLQQSATQKIDIANQVQRTSGQSCDLVGFTGCASGTTCLYNTQGTGTFCTSYNQGQSNRCNSAALWNIGKDAGKITGTISGSSVWEPPTGCMSSLAVNLPEAVVKMHLDSAVSELTLSTAEPETMVDTSLYVLPTCNAAPDTALECNDDAIGFASEVTLTNLAAGDYYVVIESASADSASFGLTATFK